VLAAAIRGQIERGELTGCVPSAETLAQDYEVATGTAERTLAPCAKTGSSPRP